MSPLGLALLGAALASEPPPLAPDSYGQGLLDGEADAIWVTPVVDQSGMAASTAFDFNGDAIVDFFDYLDFVDAFSTGC